MTPIHGQPILTAARMRAAEDRVIAAGSSVTELMERAGAGIAEAVRRLAAGAPVLVLCGPGNNGGDGYVAARLLKANGVDVRVAATGEPRSEAAATARGAWGGAVAALAEAGAAPVFVDAVFGTGLARDPDPAFERSLTGFVSRARLAIAVDLPSGVASDTGAASPGLPDFAITLALGAVKPAHVLQPGARHCGVVRLLDIGLLPQDSVDRTIARPHVAAPTGATHKYSRGMVVVIGGAMPGAAALAAAAAMHAGAGYVLLLDHEPAWGAPHALVRRRWSVDALAAATAGKPRVAVVVGPGLGWGDDAAEKLEAALASGHPLVIDGDALRLLDDAAFARIAARPADRPVVLTPHAGEFAGMFGQWSGSKIAAARDAARRSGAIVVFKGADTVIAHPDGRTISAASTSAWLSTAGTGDVLAGTVATMLATDVAGRVEAAVWMHDEAARRLGGAFVADDLAREVSAVRAAL